MKPISGKKSIINCLTFVLLMTSVQTKAHNVKEVLKSVNTAFKQEAMGPDFAENNSKIVFMQSSLTKKLRKVVIDAGHGGHDSGCVGKSSLEKHLTLQMALKLGEFINKNYPDVIVLQTRTTDVFIPLFRRIQYANEENADLFISIHCNYISNKQTRGTETFVMGLHRATDNLEVAKRENASILLEHNYEQNYEGFDPNSPEGHIMLSMYQNAYLDKSIEFAANVENAFAARSFSKSRGVKQAGFAVLRRSSMPAVLVEAGFLSNEDEEAYLISETGQNAVANSILKAFSVFYDKNLSSNLYAVENTVEKSKTKSESTHSKPQATIQTSKISEPKKEEIKKQNNIGSNTFGVQIAALKSATADMDSAELKKIGSLHIKKAGDINKYLIGKFPSHEEASKAKERLKKLGYSGAFVVNISQM
ncbi:MAG: N-acetylmuramoyl-L-alanine amidase [Saprospiraceae bacterium]|nr:N-acetylmuramoyl-L-alanine amidase [Saprospiraceae bacterium]